MAVVLWNFLSPFFSHFTLSFPLLPFPSSSLYCTRTTLRRWPPGHLQSGREPSPEARCHEWLSSKSSNNVLGNSSWGIAPLVKRSSQLGWLIVYSPALLVRHRILIRVSSCSATWQCFQGKHRGEGLRLCCYRKLSPW